MGDGERPIVGLVPDTEVKEEKEEEKKCKPCYNFLFARNLEIPHQVRNDEGIVRAVEEKNNFRIMSQL